jgi:hypothetical protein
VLTAAVIASATIFTLLVTAYFVVWNASQMVMGAVAWVGVAVSEPGRAAISRSRISSRRHRSCR